MNAFGCVQTASNPGCVPSIPASVRVLSQDNHWYSARVGVAGEATIAPNLKLSGDAAYLPFVKLVAADALPALMGNLVMGNLVNRDYEPTLAQAGDTVNVPIPPTLVANNIAEGGTVSAQNPSLGNAQIVLNTHAEATFQIPDVTRVLAVPDLLRVYMQPAVVAIAEKIETDLLNLYAGFTSNLPLGTAGTPVRGAYRPVNSAARDGEHSGLAE